METSVNQIRLITEQNLLSKEGVQEALDKVYDLITRAALSGGDYLTYTINEEEQESTSTFSDVFTILRFKGFDVEYKGGNCFEISW